MAEASAVNSEGVKRLALQEDIKKEVEGAVSVKPEPHECVVCATRGEPAGDVYTAHTACGTALAEFLNKFAADLAAAAAKHVCRSCFDLINILEQAELEYLKLRETFEAIISKNPLFDQNQTINTVKVELDQGYDDAGNSDDSEDVPLAVTKKKRRRTATVKRKKKVYAPKRKLRARNSDKDSWECIECGATGGGGAVCLAAHHLAAHALDGPAHALRDVKKEDSVDGSESSHFNNGLDSVFKVELDDFDDDDDDDFELCALVPRALSNGARARRGRPRKDSAPGSARKKREAKVLHKCDQCDAKYSTLRRLEVHREKHSGGKPPYICEVCGARYKHKRACDIHVALHKGISDWKCDECNKLFPSKGALQRHNNIHTGKLNYQCDLCGKSFIHTSSFKMHKLSHSGVKPHACDVCGLALMTRSHLKRHKRVHSGEKRHECGVCGKRFSERYNLAAHSKSHEGGEGGAEGAGAGVGAGGGGAEGARAGGQPRRRLFRCNFCQERFERRYMLERHMSVSHGRTLERVPPTPRNTMSKLLKAQAQARAPSHPPPAPAPAPHPHTPASDVLDPKEERSPDSRASSVNAHKMQLAAASTTITAGSWSSAYAAEFGLRHDFPH